MKKYLGLVLTALLMATNGFTEAPTTSKRPVMRPDSLIEPERPITRPMPRPEPVPASTTAPAPVTYDDKAFLDAWQDLDNPHLREEIPPSKLKSDAGPQPTVDGLLKAENPDQLDPADWEQKAYQVSGVTFLGPVSAAEASRLTSAPIREVYVDKYPVSNNRTYNTYGLLNHMRHLKDAQFASSFVSEHSGGLGRSDVAGAQSLVRDAGVAVTLAEGTLMDAKDNMKGMGLVQAAAIAEAEAAVAAAKEALRLAQEALAKAAKEREEDEKAADEAANSN